MSAPRLTERPLIPVLCLLMLGLWGSRQANIILTSPWGVRGHPHDIHLHLDTLSIPHICEGRVLDAPRHGAQPLRVTLALRRCRRGEVMVPVVGRVELFADALRAHVDVGMRVRVVTRLRAPTRYENPGTTARARARAARGIALVGRLARPDALRVMADEAGWLLRLGQRWRRAGARVLSAEVVGAAASGVLRAMIMGDGSGLSLVHWEQLRRVGVVHLCVVSGLHVGAVAMALSVALLWLFSRSPWLVTTMPVWRIAAGCALVVLWGYVWLTGMRIPAIRAGILVTLVLSARILDRRADMLNALAAAAIVILAWDPLSLWLPSFQLTFAAVAGIVLVLARVQPWHVARRLWRWLWGLIVTTGAATWAVTPLVAWHFAHVSLMGLVANLFFVPLVAGCIVPLGLVVLVLAPWWTGLARVLAMGLGHLTDGMLLILSGVDAWSAPWQLLWRPSGVELVAWYAVGALALGWRWRRRWSRRMQYGCLGVVCCLVGMVIVHRVGTTMHQQPLRLTVLDVGQGSAAVLEFPNGRVYLIDGGGVPRSAFDIGRWVVAPALHALGITHVDRLIMSHHHPDHYAGLAYIAEAFGPEVLYHNGSHPGARDTAFAEFATRVRTARVRQAVLSRTTPAWQEGDVTMRVVHPTRDVAETHRSENDRSIVVVVEYGTSRWILPGDIEIDVEHLLVDERRIEPATVVVAPHHGSDTSSTRAWAAHLRPQHVLISCGRANRFGFPHAEVVARYRDGGATIHRTDVHGAISVVSDGRTEAVTHFLPTLSQIPTPPAASQTGVFSAPPPGRVRGCHW